MMKSKKIIFGIVLIICMLMYSIDVYAISFNLDIIGENTVEVYETIQLKAEYWVGNDLGETGEVSREDVTDKSSWTSSNTDIAIVDSKGLVTGISEGTVTITAKYDIGNGDYREANYNITVEDNFIGIIITEGQMTGGVYQYVLNEEETFDMYLYNIPKTEKENIKLTTSNESIAKVIGKELYNYEDGSGDNMVGAKIRFVGIGDVKFTASIEYNGNTYSNSYDFTVKEKADSLYNLTISGENSIEVNRTSQLKATLVYAMTGPEDVSSDSKIEWSSSNEQVATVDGKGLVTGESEGTVIITAKYNEGDETVTVTYNIKVTDSTKMPVNPGPASGSNNNNSPSTSSNSTTAVTVLSKAGVRNIIYILLVSCLILAILVYIVYKNIIKHKNYY